MTSKDRVQFLSTPLNFTATSRYPDAPTVAVLGAGLSGLSVAWHLQRAGIRVTVFEAAQRAGGMVGGKRHGEWFHEGGPNSLFESAPEVTDFINTLGLRSRALSASPTAKKRYIVRNGKPIALPTSPLDFISNGVLSWRGKLAIFQDIFRRRADPNGDETVSEFVVRRLGTEFLEYIVDPFVSGVFAGDPSRLSVRHAFPKLHALEQAHGSLIRGAIMRRNPSGSPRGKMISFPNGLAEMTSTLASQLGSNLRLSTKITGIRRTPNGIGVDYVERGIYSHADFSAVVSTLPAHVFSELHFDGHTNSEALLPIRKLEHPPLVSVFTGFRRIDVKHPLDGFGLLVPRREQRRILGTLFSSSLFAARAPKGCVALTTFLGGMRQPQIAQMRDQEILDLIQFELRTLLGAEGKMEFASLQRWPHSIPQYNLGFQQIKDAYRSFEESLPGFFIGGNCREGISLANCIVEGKKLAGRVAEFAR